MARTRKRKILLQAGPFPQEKREYGWRSLLLLLSEMGVLLSISRASNARMSARKRRQQEETDRKLGRAPRRPVYRRQNS